MSTRTDNKITVFTPTYNRADLLPRLYRSLIDQTDQHFEWLIIDDASNDDTADVVKAWILEKKLCIHYICETVNGGLQRAINHAYSIVEDGYILKVDSDDFLLPHAIKFFKSKIDNIVDEKCLGIGAMYLLPDMRPLVMGGGLCRIIILPYLSIKEVIMDMDVIVSKYIKLILGRIILSLYGLPKKMVQKG